MPVTDISRIGFGCWQIGGSNIVSGKNIGWTSLDENLAIDLITKAHESGIIFFDTADGYGNGKSEILLGKALSNITNIEVCTKFGWHFSDGNFIQDFSHQRVTPALELSLHRLQKKKVSHFLLHNPKPADITPELVEAMKQAKSMGLTDNIGLSVNFIEPYLDHIDHFDSFELLHNALTTQNEVYFDKLISKNIFIRSVFASGLLLMDLQTLENGTSEFSDWRSSLPVELLEKVKAFIKQNPIRVERYAQIVANSLKLPVTRVIIGMSKPAHLDELLA